MKYYVHNRGLPRTEAAPLKKTWIPESPINAGALAELAAEDFWSNYGGWDCKWPLVITLIFNDGTEGNVDVDMEAQPSFVGRVIEETEEEVP